MSAKTRAKLLRYAWRARRKGGVPARRAYPIARWAWHYKVPLSVAYAVIERESNFQNVFGHDPVRSIRGGKVTKERYLYYKRRRKRGMGMQGVGPGQLTWYGYQDLADKLGGCWKYNINIRVSMKILGDNIKRHGLAKGVERYNGAGPQAIRYSAEVRSRSRYWYRILTKGR